MSKFKIGDRVIGNKGANDYAFTKEGYVGIVSNIIPVRCGNVIIITPIDGRAAPWYVYEDDFDLYEINETDQNLESNFYDLVTGEWR